MPTDSNPPLRQRIQPRVMRVLNVPMRWILALPYATPLTRQLMLLHLTGRNTGRHYRQPVSYIRDGQTLLTPGGGKWKLNLMEGRPERIRLCGRDVHARPEIVGDIDEVERLLDIMTAANARVAKFVPIPRDQDGRLDRTKLENAIKHGFRIVRWHLEAGGPGL
jgi:hypothetical protein